MTLLLHTLLFCVTALAPACAGAGESPAGNAGASPAVYTADAVVIPSDDQGTDALALTRRMDGAGRAPDGRLPQLAPQEHMRRAGIYHANRAFEEARAHWRAVIERYPQDVNVPAAHFLTGRSLFQERRYVEALPIFEKLGDTYPQAEGGRDGFYYVAATLLRLDRPGEAAARYAQYVERFPDGERVENAYLNIVDSLREAGRGAEALPWVERTRRRFPGTPTDTNALFARLRLEMARADWPAAVRTSDELSRASFPRAVNTTAGEVAYLRAYSMEQSGQKEQALRAYQAIPDTAGSYYGARATERLRRLGAAGVRAADAREGRVRTEIRRRAGDYPAPFRETLLKAVAGRSVDPRLMLSIMRQESGFNPRAKSNAGARGLMQFTPDVAAKYAPQADLSNLQEDDLFRPEVSIMLAGAYLDVLIKMFPGLPEAAAASYNGGEENVARWVKRTTQRNNERDNGVFTSEIGFTESKDYAVKVLANYRAYRELYTQDLKPRR